MNLNLGRYAVQGRDPVRIDDDEGDWLTHTLDEHLTVLATGPAAAGTAFTGRQALLPETDLPDAYRVWNETANGTWVWIDTDGDVCETFDPFRYKAAV